MLAPDLVGCKVSEILFQEVTRDAPYPSIVLILRGRTGKGEDVDGHRIIFKHVTNLGNAEDFLTKKPTIRIFGKSEVIETPTWKMRFPKTITYFKFSSSKASYDDPVLTEIFGPPADLKKKEQYCLLALDDKRFEGRKPFPIAFREWSLESGDAKPKKAPKRKWTSKQIRQLGMQFVDAVATKDMETVNGMLADSFRKAYKEKQRIRHFGDFLGAAEQLAKADSKIPIGKELAAFRKNLSCELETEENKLFEGYQKTPKGFSPDSLVANISFKHEFLRESLDLNIVEENGELRIA